MGLLRTTLLAFFCCISVRIVAATFEKVSYQSCGETQILSAGPQRAISIDINTTEIMLSLGLGSRMVAFAGIEDHKLILPALNSEALHLASIKASYPSLESLVALRPDFVFAGWQYGFSEASGLTPRRLAGFGIASYALNESCIRVRSRIDISFEDVYSDIRTIGRIFGVEARAEALIADYSRRAADIKMQAAKFKSHKIFLYDSGEASPFTAGHYGIPTAMIEILGSKNIFDDLPMNWVAVSWEDVVQRRPEFIIIVDYGDQSADKKRQFIARKLKNSGISLMDQGRYIVLPYAAVTPGIRTIDATEKLMQALQKAFPDTRT